jgi:release factor glutamine methyltransferase
MRSGELLQTTARVLKEHGIEDSLIEARILLECALNLSTEQLLANPDKSATQSQIDRLNHYTGRRIAREPTAYILQSKEFYGRDFYVDSRVLIPRPETELLVEKTIDYIKNNRYNAPLTIADIGTGSGIIAVTLAREVTGSTVIAVDISSIALEVAKSIA